MASIAAYWIAFGPHGPRALPPPDEGKKVFLYTAIGVGVSLALFATLRAFAKPAPYTMTKEWQEATNEYLKVRNRNLSEIQLASPVTNMLLSRNRAKTPTPLPVSRPRATLARATSSLPLASINSAYRIFICHNRKRYFSPRQETIILPVYQESGEGKLGMIMGSLPTRWTGGERCKYGATQTMQLHFFLRRIDWVAVHGVCCVLDIQFSVSVFYDPFNNG